MSVTTLSIIGTSGRTERSLLSSQLYDRMVNAANDHLDALKVKLNLSEIHLVSGGAAWSDHVAVSLFLQRDDVQLTIHVPCDVDKTTGKYYDSGKFDFRTNPGGTANYYYRLFSATMGRNMQDDLVLAIKKGAVINTSKKGFHARNSDVAMSEYILAFTWGKDAPEDGGTLDTWKKAKGMKKHISLHTLL